MMYRIISSTGIYAADTKEDAIRRLTAGEADLDRDDGQPVLDRDDGTVLLGIVAERADRHFALRPGVHAATEIVAEWQDGRWVFLDNGQDMECSCLDHLDPLTHLRAIYGAEAIEEV